MLVTIYMSPGINTCWKSLQLQIYSATGLQGSVMLAHLVISQFLDVIVNADDIPDEQKARICKKLGEADKCLVDGADEYLQLLDVASETIRALFDMPQTLVF